MKNPYSIFFLLLLFFISCKESEESKIKNVCNDFIKGRIALEKGDSIPLKAVTEDSLYKIIVLNERYAKMLDAAMIKANLNIEPVLVEIKGNTAICQMSGDEYYKIHLYKTKNIWKVNGENNIFPDSKMIMSSQKKLDNYKVFLKKKPAIDSILSVVNLFFAESRTYFKNNDSEAFKETCTDDTVIYLKNLFSYAKKRTGEKLLTEEMEQQNIMVGDVEFEGDKATFKFSHENIFILFKKIENSYKITGFNGLNSKNISEQIIKKNYLDLLRATKLIRPEQYKNKEIK